jgi:hypothetical protein
MKKLFDKIEVLKLVVNFMSLLPRLSTGEKNRLWVEMIHEKETVLSRTTTSDFWN